MSDSGYQNRVLKHLAALLAKEEGREEGGTTSSAKDVLTTLAGLAGKGKDELIQSICREIGQATAAVLKEPLAQLLKDRKLQVTIELVPVMNNNDKVSPAKTPKPRASKKAGKNNPKRS